MWWLRQHSALETVYGMNVLFWTFLESACIVKFVIISIFVKFWVLFRSDFHWTGIKFQWQSAKLESFHTFAPQEHCIQAAEYKSTTRSTSDARWSQSPLLGKLGKFQKCLWNQQIIWRQSFLPLLFNSRRQFIQLSDGIALCNRACGDVPHLQQ